MSGHADVDTRVDGRRRRSAAAARALTSTVVADTTVPQTLALTAQHDGTAQGTAQVGVDHQSIAVSTARDGVYRLLYCRHWWLYGLSSGGSVVSGGDWYGSSVSGGSVVSGGSADALVDDYAISGVAECGDVAAGVVNSSGCADGWCAWVGAGVVVGGGSG